jgi:hypothetical protein
MLAFYKNALQQLDAIEDCLKARRILPALCLLYSVIDVTASLERQANEGTKAAFVRWVDENMLSRGPLPCTASELYSARCGVLHTFTPDSDLFREGRARRVLYAWGNASAKDLQDASYRLGRTDVAVHVSELLRSFRGAFDDYVEKVIHDPERLRQIEAQDTQWFTPMGQDVLKEFLTVTAPQRSS